MKKLNRKGFTLVELLAVIIILAIVVGITIPAILNTTTSAKQKAFATAADTSADWIERQYQTYLIDKSSATANGVNSTLKDKFDSLTPGSVGKFNIKSTDNGGTALIEAAGLKTSNVTAIQVYVSTQSRICVLLTGAGDYAGVGAYDANANAVSTKTGNNAMGGACSGASFLTLS